MEQAMAPTTAMSTLAGRLRQPARATTPSAKPATRTGQSARQPVSQLPEQPSQ
jgi:hypothetical protein